MSGTVSKIVTVMRGKISMGAELEAGAEVSVENGEGRVPADKTGSVHTN